jgi:hypothetical protein
MQNKNTVSNFTLKIQSGGYLAFEKAEIMPMFLVFNCQALRITWRFKLKNDKKNGVLKINGQIAFSYFFDGLGCKIQNLTDGSVGEKWEIEEVLMEMKD